MLRIMVTPFINNYEVVFYKLNSDLSADFSDILTKISPNTIFLYMNYFGIPTLTVNQLRLLQKDFLDLIYIEDCTHDFLNRRKEDFIPDYLVCSVRKWLAIPDGGFLISKEKINFPKETDLFFSNLRLQALKNKSKYLKNGMTDLKAQYRMELAHATEYLDKSTKVVDISQESIELIMKIDFDKIYNKRKENAEILYKELNKVDNIRLLPLSSFNSTLYFPILVNNRDIIQKELAKQNIYCPVIWPLPDNQVCKVSKEVADHMLALPCDHRYHGFDMKHISGVLKNILESLK